MDTSCSDRHLYPLTSLQIGDIKTNLSQAYLYFASDSKKFLILVDNQSWRRIKHSKSTHIKAFVTTSYRDSPFRNTRPIERSPSFNFISSNFEAKSLFKWFPNILGKALHGFIIFEVSWQNVRGISYLNELQTDARIALEVRSLTKWEFSGIDQALSSMPSWFSGDRSEIQTLRTNLVHLQNQVPSQDKFFDTSETLSNDIGPSSDDSKDRDIEPIIYEDTLLQCMFNDRDIPFELKPMITSDQRLLILVESGLPSWVIFLQSYPIFCALYRPWMRPVFRTLYILVSLVTVVIGFYDLYKNVPLLKSTVSHLCGPLFKWIESWEMITRLRYLGTMLFLQNLEKTVKMFLTVTRWLKHLVSLVTETLSYPFAFVVDFFMPTWSLFSQAQMVVVGIIHAVVDKLDDVFIVPFEFVYSYMSSLGTLVYPILCYVWELVLIVVQGCLVLANCFCSVVSEVYEVVENWFEFAFKPISQLASLARERPNSSDFSHFHSLWKDLFSKVFHSLRSVLRALYAFIASLKRHRLSINNYFGAFLQKLCNNTVPSSSSECSCQLEPRFDDQIKVGDKECERCKKMS